MSGYDQALESSERMARLGLCAVIDSPDERLRSCLNQYSVVELWEQLRKGYGYESWQRRAKALNFKELERQVKKYHLRFVIPGDLEWPLQLEDLENCQLIQGFGGVPIGLFLAGNGNLAEISAKSVAIVGARAASLYGMEIATDFGYELSELGYGIISGGAYGIDAAAHRGAVAAGKTTVAVMAGGVVESYPRGNKALFNLIEENGLLISEIPPLSHPTRYRFLARNRLIAALSQGTVIIEGMARSGASNTANWANTLGREVMAIPGLISSPTSVTPHQLIRDGGATLVTSVAEVTELLEPLKITPMISETTEYDLLTSDEKLVYEAFPARGVVSLDQLVVESGLSVSRVLRSLEKLSQKKLAKEQRDGWLRISIKQAALTELPRLSLANGG